MTKVGGRAKKAKGRGPLDPGGSTQLAVHLPNTWLREIDDILESWPADGLLPTRVVVLRTIIRRGLDARKSDGKSGTTR
jgi:hypothetical protein